MNYLKRIIKKAIAAKAMRIKIVDGQPVEFLTSDGIKSISDEPAAADGYIKSICGQIFPKSEQQNIAQGTPVKGSLQAPPVGKIFMIADAGGSNSLRLYLPPNGEAMFNKAWAEVRMNPNTDAQAYKPDTLATNVQPNEVPTSAKPTFTSAAEEGSISTRIDAPAAPAVPEFEDSIASVIAPTPVIQGNTAAPSKNMPPPPPAKSEAKKGATNDPPSPIKINFGGAPGKNKKDKTSAGVPAPQVDEPKTAAVLTVAVPSQSSAPVKSDPQVPLQAGSKDISAIGSVIPGNFQMQKPPPGAPPMPQPGQPFVPQGQVIVPQPGQVSNPVGPHLATPNLGQPGQHIAQPGQAPMPPPQHMPPMPGQALSHPGMQAFMPQLQNIKSPSGSHPSPPAQPLMAQAPIASKIIEQVKVAGPQPIDDLLREMVKRKASDMHLTTGEPVIYRIDGEITRMPGAVITAEMMLSYSIPICHEENIKEFEATWDTDFAYELAGCGRFRVNLFRDRAGIGMVLRHIPSKILTMDELNLPPSIKNFCRLSKGLVLVTGPTGSGKSTTLAAMIDHINKTRKEHILTIEDPIEFVHPQQNCLVNQREISRHTKSFTRALKAALREDPDIILIGEMRDLETVSIAIETAETGHLVFGTLHTTTAISTVDRIIDQFPSEQQEQIRMMLASSLKGVVSQTLLKKIGGGRVAAQEVLVVNDAVSAMIREGKNHMIANHMTSQRSDGNELLNDALVNLVLKGIVRVEDAYVKAIAKKDFILSLKSRGGSTTELEALLANKAS
jgi:twitching motility protein PilT